MILAFAPLVIPASVNASDWSWNLTPYVWGSDVTLDAEVNDQEIISGEVDFSDLIDDADFAIMAHLEGKRDRFGVFADLIVTDFGDEPRIFDRPNVTIQAKSDLEMVILELGGVWYPGGDGTGFGVHYGARIIDVDQEIDIVLVGRLPTDRRIVDVSTTLVDGLVGVRYSSELSDDWSFAAWGDVGSGGTDGTWSAAAVFGYHFGAEDQFALRFGYRHLAIEIEEDDRLATVESEIAMSGPQVGFSFTF
jgi:hypothetical protein